MKRAHRLLAAALMVCAGQVAAQSQADKEGWYFQQFSETNGYLYYGGFENDELLVIGFGCTGKSSAVDVLMREVSQTVKPGDHLCVAAVKDGGKTELCGKAINNELAGVPDFEAIVSRHLSLLAPTSDETGQLTLSYKSNVNIVPLAGFNKARDEFMTACYGAPK